MKNKSTLFLLFFCCIHLFLSAKPVDINNARIVARNIFSERYQSRFPDQKSIAFSMADEFSITEDNKLVYYIFNTSNNGFVIVAADDIIQPVLGFSFEGNYSLNNQPPQFVSWMKMYAMQIADAIDQNLNPGIEATQEWNRLLKSEADFSPAKDVMDVAELLTTKWDQGAYYNGLCPVDAAGPGGRVYAGCVATSMAQVMNYYKYPTTGTGSHGYYSDYGYLSVNFANTTYDWNSMTNQLFGTNNAVATLLYHCGVAVDMAYAPDGSGAQTTDAAYALEDYFKYSNTIQSANKSTYTTTNWENLLKGQLDIKRPMMYAGYDPNSGAGHAWVCDGYSGTNYFHFNWGWSGYYNGYFYLSNLNPGSNNLTSNQRCVYNIFPGSNYPQYCAGTKTLTGATGNFNDGSGPTLNYQNNADCNWLITPADVDHLTLSFDYLNTEAGNDLISIYDGPDNTYPLLGTYSGSTLPNSIISTSPAVFVNFISDGANVDAGWQINYTSSPLVFCNGVSNLTADTDTFSDGSGYRNYNNGSNCKWQIEPVGAGTVTISFTSFDTEQGKDLVRIIDPDGTTVGFPLSFSGSSIPQSATSTSGKMLVIFTSNSSVTSTGWNATYTSTPAGIEETESLKNISIYPNPANDVLNVSLNINSEQSLKIELINAIGEIVYSADIKNALGEISKSLDLSGYSKGIYSVRLTSEKQNYLKKIVIQ